MILIEEGLNLIYLKNSVVEFITFYLLFIFIFT